MVNSGRDEGAADSTLLAISRRYVDLLRIAERSEAIELVLGAADEYPLEQIYTGLLQEAQYEVGRLWEANEISVAQEHYSTAVTQLIMSLLYPRVSETPKTRGTFVGVCVEGEMHEVGIRMVCDLFELRGWKSLYLGASIPSADLLRFVEQRPPDVIGISAIYHLNVEGVRQLITQLRSREQRHVTIMAGGRPFLLQSELWREVGADGTAVNAAESVEVAENLLAAATGSST
jgi:methanogenic corrinoid protein MtbC1